MSATNFVAYTLKKARPNLSDFVLEINITIAEKLKRVVLGFKQKVKIIKRLAKGDAPTSTPQIDGVRRTNNKQRLNMCQTIQTLIEVFRVVKP